jgi:hypothetical protein
LTDITHNVDDFAAGLAPDTLLPSQYFDRIRRRVGGEGERRLMVAVLEDAVNVYLRHAGAQDAAGEALFLETEAWFESRETAWLFSFERICRALDLEPDYLRRGLRARVTRASDAVPEPERPAPTGDGGADRPRKAVAG